MKKDIADFTFNINSSKQMQEFLFDFLKLKPIAERNEKGNISVNEAVITHYAEKENVNFCKSLIKYRKLTKAKRTYLADIKRNISELDGCVHSEYWLNIAETYRSCLAKGTLIDTVRNVSKHPNGIPIENIKIGDLVYCYDNNLKPTIQKVLWAGKTGHKKIIRVHWKTARSGKKGYLDCTPKHLIRLTNGKYVKAQNLVGDLRNKKDSKHKPKVSVLALSRKKDRLFFTGVPGKHGRGILEHRFIYKTIRQLLHKSEVIHHIDNNHYNHSLNNLKKMSLRRHSRLHSDRLQTPLSRLKNRIVIKRKWRNGEMKNAVRYGKEHPLYLGLTALQCLKEISRTRGAISRSKHDFNVFKNYLKLHNIKHLILRLRYNSKGDYISRNYLIGLIKAGKIKNEIQKTIKMYSAFDNLLQHYNLTDWEKIKKEDCGNNHIITKIEWLNKNVDVYDIEVEKHHNFIANEICVHNSSSNPNSQNTPKHGDIIPGLAWQLIRKMFSVPNVEKNWLFGEVDYVGAETKPAAMLSDDEQMIYDLNHDLDMHSHWAKELFGIKKSLEAIKRENKDERFLAKNNFTFANIFGAVNTSIATEMRKSDFYRTYAESEWKKVKIKKGKFEKFYTDFSENQVLNAQNTFYTRYPAFKKWQDKIVRNCYMNGYVENPFGFRRRYPLTKNEIINYPIQSTSFLLLLDSLIHAEKDIVITNLISRLIGQVHDSGLNRIWKPEIEQYIHFMDNRLTKKPHLKWTQKVKMETEWDLGVNWLETFSENVPFKSTHIKTGISRNERIIHWMAEDLGLSAKNIYKCLVEKDEAKKIINGWKFEYI